jgi:hypothetical protein
MRPGSWIKDFCILFLQSPGGLVYVSRKQKERIRREEHRMKGNKGLYLVAMVAVIALCGVGTAQASGWTTNITTSTPIGSTLTDWTQSFSFPKYQTAWSGGGTLTQIDFTVSSSLDTYFSITNSSPAISTGILVKTEITISIKDPSLLLAFTNLNPWVDSILPSTSFGWILAPGAITNLGTYTSTASGIIKTYTDAGVMSEFTGIGSILLPANAHAETLESYAGGNVDIAQITHASLTGSITYWATTIPEPSTVLLVGLGLAAVAWRLRRRS